MADGTVELRGIGKSYGGVRALSSLDLVLRAGEAHAICGENGAGKSTLNRILSGSVLPDSGSILVDGLPLMLGSIQASEAAGIAIVHQESAAFLDLSATENFELARPPAYLSFPTNDRVPIAGEAPASQMRTGRPRSVGVASRLWLDRRAMRVRAVEGLATVGESFDPDVNLESRSLAQRQMLAIAAAVSRNCRLLILDEPTASLSSREAEALFEVIRRLRDDGVAVLYVSHRLEEIFQLADRITVLRDGQLVETRRVSEFNHDSLVRAMVGRSVEFEPRPSYEPGRVYLQVEDLSREGVFRDVSFSVKAGEVVALAGLIGAGRSEVARAIFGLDKVDAGRVLVNGKKLAMVPEDRQHQGLHLPLPIRDNLMMATSAVSAGIINCSREKGSAARLVEELSIRTPDDLNLVSSLSGGNQQKVLLGKWLSTEPEVLILDEPTRGVDVGAKDQIHRLIDSLAKRGVAVLVISSEMNEVLALADRVVVMRQGAVAGELTKAEASQERILALALPREGEAPVEALVRSGFSREMGVAALLLATVIGAAIVNPSFLALDNLRDMLVRVAPALIVGVMMTLVILAREIDISIGSLMGLCAATLGIAASPDRLGLSPVVAGVACLVVGVLGGVMNGALVAFGRIPSIIVTLGTLTLFKGATEIALAGKWIENMPAELRSLGAGSVGGIPPIVLVASLFVLAGFWIAKRTRLGLKIYALGSNPAAAALVGIRQKKIQLAVFSLTGLAAGVAALFSATQLQVIESGFGSGFELVVVAAVIVGGTSIRGGRGSMTGTLLGATILGIVATVLIFLRLGQSATYWERAIQGGFILLAVLGDHFQTRRRKSV